MIIEFFRLNHSITFCHNVTQALSDLFITSFFLICFQVLDNMPDEFRSLSRINIHNLQDYRHLFSCAFCDTAIIINLNSSYFHGYNNIYKASFQCPCITENMRVNCCIYKRRCVSVLQQGRIMQATEKRETEQAMHPRSQDYI